MTRQTYLWIVILLSCLCVYLGLKGLDNALFWDDEAQVAVIAKNYLQSGHLTGWDGRNLYAYRNGGLLDEHLQLRVQPLDILITAGAFKVFGVSTWSARIPFVILGLLVIPLLLMILKLEFNDEYWLQLFIFINYVFSCNYLLYIRQSRYYSLSILFSLCIYYLYQRYRASHNRYWYWGIGIFAILSFYANPMLCAAFLGSMLGYHFLFHGKLMRRTEWQHLLESLGLFIVGTVGYAWSHKIWIRWDQDFGVQETWWLRKWHLVVWNFRDLNLINVLPWMLVIGMVWFWWTEKDKSVPTKKILGWGLIGLLNVLLIALISPQASYSPSIANVRYLVVSFPFLAGLTGWMLWKLKSQHRLWGIIILVIFLCSNVLCWLPATRFILFPPEIKWLFPAYLKEIHQPYPTCYDAAVEFVQSNVKQDDLITSYPEYYNYPLMFYVGKQVHFSSTIDPSTKLDMDKIRQLAPWCIKETSFPDWILFFGVNPGAQDMINYFSRPHQSSSGQWEKYQYSPATVTNTYWDQTQRPELFWHHFGPKTPVKPPSDVLWVFKKQPDAKGLDSYLQTFKSVKKP